MQFSTFSKAFLLGITLSITSALIAQTANTNTVGCLDGICVNASIQSLPSNIAWLPLLDDEMRSYVNPNYQDEANKTEAKRQLERGIALMKGIYPEPGIEFAPIADSAKQTYGLFDVNTLNHLKRINIACRPFAWRGTFKSSSGFLTEITLMAYPSGPIKNPSAQENFRVQKIKRYYPDIAMGTEFEDLKIKATDAIGMRVNDKSRAMNDVSPIASLSRSAAKGLATLEILDMPLGSFNPKTFGSEAECKSRISAN
jgi:hypothetical protein